MTDEQIAAKIIEKHEFWEELEEMINHYIVTRQAYTDWQKGRITEEEFHDRVYGLDITDQREDEE